MARERWFYARAMRRMGPLPKRQLLEALLALPDPRGCLVWRHGLSAWTPAGQVPEIDQQLATLVKAEPVRLPDPEPVRAPVVREVEAGPSPAPRPSPPASAPPRARQTHLALYAAGITGLLAVGVGGWLWWRASGGQGEEAGGRSRSGGALAASGDTGAVARAGEGSAGSVGERRTAGSPEERAGSNPSAFAGWSDREVEVGPDQLRLLRGVGGWTGSTLTITLYNGSTWRITEILVRTSHLAGDQFIDAETPHWLLPKGGAPVDAGMADLLKKVAPDRKKAGVNPLDTGAFEATVGPKPEAFRWRIEGARGYPPRG